MPTKLREMIGNTNHKYNYNVVLSHHRVTELLRSVVTEPSRSVVTEPSRSVVTEPRRSALRLAPATRCCGRSWHLLLLTVLLLAALSGRTQTLPGNIRIPTGGGGGGATGGVVLDDSSHSVYGPTTTAYFFEDDILNNRDSVRYHVDTSLANFHRWSFVDKSWNQLVDLGNLGTASRQLFFEPRSEVGRQLGFRAYNPYGWKAEEIRYFDTKSPYTDMYFVMGGHNRDMLKFGFTQNINPEVNVGLRLQRFTSQRQYGDYAARGSEAALARNWNFLLHGSYFSKDKKYALMAHLRTMNHSAREQGGVVLGDTINWVIVDDDYEGPARLSNTAKSWERRTNVRLFHQYRLLSGFQLFHQVEYQGTINRYIDNVPETGVANGVYPTVSELSQYPPINQTVTSLLLDNRVGIKGAFAGYNYRAYFRTRAQTLDGQYYLTDSTSGKYGMQRLEPIVGVWMQYHLRDSTWKLTANGEHVLARDLLLKGQLDIPWARVGFQTALTSPDLMMSQYKNAYLLWNNTDAFNLAKTVSFTGAIPLKTERFYFTPEFQWHQLINYLYYDENSMPRQDEGTFSLMRIGFDAGAALKRWNSRLLAYYTEGFDNKVIRIPRLFFSGEVSFAFTYAKAMDVQLGIAAHYTTSYYADAYMPVTQQFYIQNNQQTGNYFVADAFANLRIKRVLLLLKYSHLNKGLLTKTNGYFLTPGYMALKPAFAIGVSWPLFD